MARRKEFFETGRAIGRMHIVINYDYRIFDLYVQCRCCDLRPEQRLLLLYLLEGFFFLSDSAFMIQALLV